MSEAILEFFASLPKELYVLVVSMFPIIELRGAIPLGAGLGMPFYTNYLCSVIGNIIPVPFILLFISKMLDFLARFRLTRPAVEWLRKKANKHSSKVLVESTPDSSVSEASLNVSTDKAEAEADPLAKEVSDADAYTADTERAEAEGENAPLMSEGKYVLPTSDDPILQNEATPEAENIPAAAAELPTENDASADTLRDSADIGDKKFASAVMSSPVFWALTLFVAIPLPGTGAWTGSLIAALFGLPKRKSFLAVSLGVLISGVIMSLASYGVVGFLKIFI